MANIGVIIGRFQTPDLHPGHHYLFAEVMSKHDRLCILVGTREAQATSRDPLDFETRKAMIEKQYPDAVVRRLDDCATNEAWSARVDEILGREFHGSSITLYGSRDSFIGSYLGAYPCALIREVPNISATVLRNQVMKKPEASAAFRAGVIYGAGQRFPTSYQVVDVAVLSGNGKEVLLARKRHDAPLWRFIGGFVDPADGTLEEAARREVAEEANMIEIGDVTYVASARIPDFRYRGQPDQIMTSFFAARYVYGNPVATDDIVEVAWHPVKDVTKILLANHRMLGEALERFIGQKEQTKHTKRKERSHV